MSAEQDPITKLPKLGNSKDYIHWRRRVHAFIRRNDFELLGFTEEPVGASVAIRKKWLEAMIKAKSSIVLSLGSGPLAQLSAIIDDDERTAKELWDGLHQMLRPFSTLRMNFESLRFDENGSWEKHLDSFHEILGKLASYDSQVKEEDKASKLLRTLPKSFAPLAMVAETSDLSLDRVVIAVEGELSRRLSKKDKDDVKASDGTRKVANASRKKHVASSIKEGFIDNKKKNLKNVQCYVCGRYGHYARDCWHKHAESSQPGFRGRGRGSMIGRGRGQGRGF